MTDTVAILRDRLAKGEAKVARLRKQLESAETEVSDVQTALRVLDQLLNQSTSESGGGDGSTTLARQNDIVSFLPEGRENATAPADLYETFKSLSFEQINIDTFRTTIWRMKGKVYTLQGRKWVVEGDNGNYWKRAVEDSQTQEPKLDPQDEQGNLERALGKPFVAADAVPWDADDDDPPF